MKKCLALVLFALIMNLSLAQKGYQEVVYLADGSIIIETTDKKNFDDYIINTAKEESVTDRTSNLSTGSGLKRGYNGIIEMGYQIGVGDFNINRLKFNIINGYQISPYFSLGFGTGLRYYYTSDAVIMPFFADFRATFMDNNISPYISLGLGYSFDIRNSFEHAGTVLNPTIGVTFRVSERSMMFAGLGYDIPKRTLNHYWYGHMSSNYSGFLDINVGISF